VEDVMSLAGRQPPQSGQLAPEFKNAWRAIALATVSASCRARRPSLPGTRLGRFWRTVHEMAQFQHQGLDHGDVDALDEAFLVIFGGVVIVEILGKGAPVNQDRFVQQIGLDVSPFSDHLHRSYLLLRNPRGEQSDDRATSMNVQFRDVRYAVPFLVQAWVFATPIAYPSSLLDEPCRTLYGINPMAGVVEGFRWALLGMETAPGPIILVSASVAVRLLISGAFYFRRMEKTFADVV
jgi:hypothetical protein